jgi:prephenate dehydratase
MNTTEIRVAIQGGRGAFHEIAARKFFGSVPISILPCETFPDLFSALARKEAECGMVAMENSLAGSLLQNHTLLRESGLKIAGEQYLRVVQNLIALPGQRMDGIREIHSHPVAIQQCDVFLKDFRQRGVRVVESADTALSVKWIHDRRLEGTAALASAEAAQLYGMEILKAGVETHKRNFTRFQLITANENVMDLEQVAKQTIDKASLCFTLRHESGRLSQVLSVLSFYGMNLTRIQSLPIVGTEWEYFFYTDLIFSEYDRYRQAIEAVLPLTEHLQILGEYKNGQQPPENQSLAADRAGAGILLLAKTPSDC